MACSPAVVCSVRAASSNSGWGLGPVTALRNYITYWKTHLSAARKALSCVYRSDQRFGAGHVIDILRGMTLTVEPAEIVTLLGPNGCGKSELVREAAKRAGTQVTEVDISRVFKPEKLLDRLSTSVNAPSGPRVIFVDRLETLTGDDALSTFRTQFVAVLRWFLEEVAAKPQGDLFLWCRC